MSRARTSIDGGYVDEFLGDVEFSKSEGTYDTRRTDTKSFYSWLTENTDKDLLAVTSDDIDSYLVHLVNEDYAPNTVKSRYDSVRELFRYLVNQGEIDENPHDGVDYSRFKRHMTGTLAENSPGDDIVYVTPEEVDQMADNVSNPKSRNELIIRLLFQTGVRAHECRNIKIESINLENRKIDIYSEKTHESRSVFYQPSLEPLMSLWINQLRGSFAPAKRSKYLFLSNQSEQITRETIRRVVRDAAENADIQESRGIDARGQELVKITPHTLRHGHCVHAVTNGEIDITFIRKHAGHKNLETTKRYLQVKDEDVKDAYRAFER